MANLTTISRPYARAIIEIAKNDKSYAKWSEMLNYLSLVAKDKRAIHFFKNLAIPAQRKVDFLHDLKPDMLNEQAGNLLKLLANAKRLLILPELFELYEIMRKKAENEVPVNCVVALKTSLDSLEHTIAKGIDGKLILSESIDESLIGGGMIEIGNRVVDGSIRGKLKMLRELLTSN